MSEHQRCCSIKSKKNYNIGQKFPEKIDICSMLRNIEASRIISSFGGAAVFVLGDPDVEQWGGLSQGTPHNV